MVNHVGGVSTGGGDFVGNFVTGSGHVVSGDVRVGSHGHRDEAASISDVLALLERLEEGVRQADVLPGQREEVLEDVGSASSALRRDPPNPDRAAERLTGVQRVLSAIPSATGLASLVLQAIQMLKPGS